MPGSEFDSIMLLVNKAWMNGGLGGGGGELGLGGGLGLGGEGLGGGLLVVTDHAVLGLGGGGAEGLGGCEARFIFSIT
jgi:hypothetical protein